MKTSLQVNLPTVEEFSKKYPHYGGLVQTEGKEYFELVMRPESLFKAVAVMDALDLPAVSGVARECSEKALRQNQTLSGLMKQFIGALVCALMEKNGFEKTGTKRSVSWGGWTKGEFYRATVNRFRFSE